MKALKKDTVFRGDLAALSALPAAFCAKKSIPKDAK